MIETLLNGLSPDPLTLARRRAPDTWERWLPTLFPRHFPYPFGEHHAEFWGWVWAIRKGVRPRPFVAIWPRGGAKSTSAEAACVMLGARRARKYVLYVSGTQDQADDHVQNIGGMLESPQVEEYYPDLGSRKVGKYGASKGWRRNRVRTTSGFTVDAIGLDAAARGAKLDEDRPDFMIFDDLDGELDSPRTTQRKVKTLTYKLLPAGSSDLGVLANQNLILPDGIFSRLAHGHNGHMAPSGAADFLSDRIVSGPHPALRGMEVTQDEETGRFVVTAGSPIWEGQDRARCQEMVDDMGYSAFLSECQHSVSDDPGGIFSHLSYRRCNWDDVPWGDIVKAEVWVDPAVTSTDQSDSMGIQADAVAADGTLYRLWSWEQITSPLDALRRAILKGMELGARNVGVETDQGGDAWISVYRDACRSLVEDDAHPGITAKTRFPQFRHAKAGAGHGSKVHRAAQMVGDYERGKIVHVRGTHETLERALYRFPVTKPFDLTDAAYWSWYHLTKNRGWAR